MDFDHWFQTLFKFVGPAGVVFLLNFPAIGSATVDGLVVFRQADADDFRLAKDSCELSFGRNPKDKVVDLIYHVLYRSGTDCVQGELGQVCIAYAIDVLDQSCAGPFYIGDSGLYFDIELIDLAHKSDIRQPYIPRKVRTSRSLQRPIVMNSRQGRVLLLETKEYIYIQPSE